MNIIGRGRIGTVFEKAFNVKAFARNDKQTLVDGPIVIATRNDSLESIISNIPKDRYEDLVFVQNGMYTDLLKKLGVEDPTLILIYFAVQSVGETPVDGGGSIITGKHSELISRKLKDKFDLDVKQVSNAELEQKMYSKLLWNTVFGLMCEVFDLSVGEIVQTQKDKACALTDELIEVIEENTSSKMPQSTFEDMCDYSKAISTYQGAVKEWKWRNGWFYEKKKSTVHLELLEKINYKRFLD